MIVSFTGAQSTGKTTLLNKCKEIYTNWYFVDEVTRLVGREHNVSINETGTNDTQLLIINQHLINSLLPHSNVILDRCIIDGLVYTQYLVNTGKVEPWVLDICGHMYNHLIKKLDCVLYTCPDDIPIDDDGERSTNMRFRSDILDIFNQVLEDIYTYNNNLQVVMLTGPVDERLKMITDVIDFKDENSTTR